MNFLNESKRPQMKYYAFDWDDNILKMPTVIHMQHLVDDEWVMTDVTTEEFAKVRVDVDNWRPARTLSDKEFNKLNKLEKNDALQNTAYCEFRDLGPRGNKAFVEDAIKAINNKNFGPSWKKFLVCLTNGAIFAIITARGHEPDTMRTVVEYIIDNILTEDQRTEMGANLSGFQDMFIQNNDYMRNVSFKTLLSAYLDKCDFVGVSSPSFIEKYPDSNPANPEKGKLAALDEFVDRINTYGKQIGGDVSVGFSDDDLKTVKTIEKHFGEISPVYDDIIFSVIDTSKKEISKKRIN